MTNTIVSPNILADSLQTAVRADEPEEIATAIKAIVDQQAEQTVVAELGDRLTARRVTPGDQTVIVHALNAIDHTDTIDQLGKFLLDAKHELNLRSTILGFLQTRMQSEPTKTLTYFRQVLDRAEPAFRERILSTFELAITNIIAPQDNALIPEGNAKQILKDAGIKPAHLQASLFKDLDKLEPTPIPLPSIFAEALGLLGGQEAIDLLCQLLDQHQSAQLREEQNAMSSDGRSPEMQLDKGPIRERIMLAAVNALRTTESEAAVNCLALTLVNNLNYKVQRQAADALGKLGFQSCIPHLLAALFTESNQALKDKIGKALSEIAGWQEKASQLVTHLTQNPVKRDQMDAKIVIMAVQPSQEELTKDPHLLTDFFIDAAVRQFNNESLLPILADLIKISTNNNGNIINDQLELYREKEQVSEEILQALRVEIGGAKTLKPLLNKLEKNLLDYFQKPIDNLNSDTQKVWKRTIFLANFGFFIRILLNLAIFAIGGYFMLDSYNQIVAGNLTTEQLVALMAVFIGGGTTMFVTFQKFPLEQIKRAVADVGLANVAFISYIHCVMQISHTFSYSYLNGDISFDKIKNAAKQIEDTSHEAILTLNNAGSDGDQAKFNQALLDRMASLANKRPQVATPILDTSPANASPANPPPQQE